MLVLAVLGIAALGVAAVLAFTRDSEEPQGIAPTDDTLEVTTTDPPATATSAVEAVDESTDEPADESCIGDPGIAVLTQGVVQDFPPGEEQDGLFILGSAASVEFRLDAASNRNLILFRLVYTDGSDTHGWTEVGWYGEGSELTYDAGTGRFTGWFTLSHTVNPTGSAGENPERADVDLIYDADAGSVSGTIAHPERDFTIDLPGEEVEREFFEDPSCYPTPTEEP